MFCLYLNEYFIESLSFHPGIYTLQIVLFFVFVLFDNVLSAWIEVVPGSTLSLSEPETDESFQRYGI